MPVKGTMPHKIQLCILNSVATGLWQYLNYCIPPLRSTFPNKARTYDFFVNFKKKPHPNNIYLHKLVYILRTLVFGSPNTAKNAFLNHIAVACNCHTFVIAQESHAPYECKVAGKVVICTGTQVHILTD